MPKEPYTKDSLDTCINVSKEPNGTYKFLSVVSKELYGYP